ncbi:hypothetical protein D3C80_296700 [compost metagenome]
MELVLAAGEDAQRLTIITGSLQLFSGGFRVADVIIALDTLFRVPGEIVGVIGAVQRIKIRAAESGSQHVFHVQRFGYRLADLELGRKTFLGIEHENRVTEGLQHQRLRGGGRLHPVEGFHRNGIDIVILPGNGGFDTGIRIRNRNETDFIEILMARATIAIAFTIA